MVNRSETVYSSGSNKWVSLRFVVDSQFQHETTDEGPRTYRPKRCDYNNKDEVNNSNIQSNNNYKESFKKFRLLFFSLYLRPEPWGIEWLIDWLILTACQTV